MAISKEAQAYRYIRAALKRGRVRIELSDLDGLRLTMQRERSFYSISINIAWLDLEQHKFDPLIRMEDEMERRLAVQG